VSEDVLLVERHPEGYAVLTLNRPQALNAWSVDLCTRFSQEFAALQEDDEVRVLILTGTGRAFCAGLDVKEMRTDPEGFFSRVRAHSPGAAVQAGRKPLIGAINGDAVTGGFEIALLCDILICSENASFRDTHTRIGLMPGWGISQLLSRRVGISRAKEISLTARKVGATEAAAIGLVNAVHPPEHLMDEARRIATEMLAGVPRILSDYRALIDQGFGLPLGDALALERQRVREARQRPVGS
jgi:enoyl-CoA hydratase